MPQCEYCKSTDLVYDKDNLRLCKKHYDESEDYEEIEMTEYNEHVIHFKVNKIRESVGLKPVTKLHHQLTSWCN